MATPLEDGLRYVDADADGELVADEAAVTGDEQGPSAPRDELETLRDEFVDAFNARDLDAVLSLAGEDVECPDVASDGPGALASELADIWDRAPGAILTRGFLDDAPCGMAWLPDEEGCWTRAGLLLLDGDGDALTLVTFVVDDADALERAEADDPTGEELEEGSVWAEWDRGESEPARLR